MSATRRIGVLGYGAVGRYLCRRILATDGLELAFVYNRSAGALNDPALGDTPRLSGDLGAALTTLLATVPPPHLVVEVAHATIVRDFGARLLSLADLYVASVTALAAPRVAQSLSTLARDNDDGHGLYLPAGAAWGVQDVARMARAGSVEALTVTMRFHADALRLSGEPAARLEAYLAADGEDDPCLLFEGSVDALAPLAPNNVNTMTCLALAAAKLGPAGARARLFAHKDDHAHIVEIDVHGPDGFHVHTRRYNPARPGAVTGDQTYRSFFQSLLAAHGRGGGVHFC